MSVISPKKVTEPLQPKPEPEEPLLDTCGNGVCEEYELLSNCIQDCEGLETKNYKICRGNLGNDIIGRVRILGTNTYLDKSSSLGPGFNPEPECGKTIGTIDCFQCYNITEVHEPIFEIQIYNAVTCNLNICEAVNLKYFNGEMESCSDNKWERFGCNVYYPYDEERYKMFKRVKID